MGLMAETARKVDHNGWLTIADNPISKIGVYPYTRQSVGLDGDGIIMVYRPATELSNPDTIKSFCGVPLINDHTFLGKDGKDVDDLDGAPSARGDDGKDKEKIGGVPAVLGYDVRFDTATGTLRSSIKIFSRRLKALIDGGKRELSPGYTAKYDITPGEWQGQPYEAVQREIRGNHLALVDEGRTGPDVAVLDHGIFTIDSKDLMAMADDDTKAAPEPEATKDEEPDLAAQVAALTAGMAEMQATLAKLMPLEKGEHPELAKDGDAPPVKDEDKDKAAPAMDTAFVRKAMDEAITKAQAQALKAFSDRQKLADRLAPHIGTFDCADKGPVDVAVYGLGKLGIEVAKGAELVQLDSYLSGLEKTALTIRTADSTPAPDRASFLKRMGE